MAIALRYTWFCANSVSRFAGPCRTASSIELEHHSVSVSVFLPAKPVLQVSPTARA